MVLTEFKHNGKDHKIAVKDAKLKKSMQGYSLDVIYTIETPSEIQELHIPRLMLPIGHENVIINTDFDYYGGPLCTVDVGFGNLRVLESDDGKFFTLKTIETKTKEMTLEEIEKKLGHKVKIINK